jgi:hypothetical protein
MATGAVVVTPQNRYDNWEFDREITLTSTPPPLFSFSPYFLFLSRLCGASRSSLDTLAESALYVQCPSSSFTLVYNLAKSAPRKSARPTRTTATVPN